MGNTLLQMNSHQSMRRPKNEIQHTKLKKSRSLREYPRNSSLTTTCIKNNNHSTRRNISFSRPRSMPPIDGEIINIHELRCKMSALNVNEGEKQLSKQLDYIHSCVRKDKGFFGMITENLQIKHIFSNDEPENTHILESTPDEFNMNYRSIYLQTPDGEFLHAYWIYQACDVNSTITLLYLHGAGGNVSHRLETLQLFYDNLNCNILIIDYRGFGKSTGSPSELGIYIDAQTAYDYLIYKEKILPDNIIVLGTSLGASIAIQLVSDPLNRVKLAIFENAFVSIPEVAKCIIAGAKNIIEKTKSTGFLFLFDSIPKVRRIKCPCVYLSGLQDPIVPSWMSNQLYNETQNSVKCQLFEYAYGKHNDLPIMNDYFENIQRFLDELIIRTKSEGESTVH